MTSYLRLYAFAALTIFAFCAVVRGQADPPGPLATLRPSHPRLLVLDDDVKHASDLIATDARAQEIYAAMKAQAEKDLTLPPVTRVLNRQEGLLDTSRLVLDRVALLAGLYRLDHDRRWADRADQEMLAVASFPDWNPVHFLDTAEMTTAVAIGYDWLYDVLSPTDRATIRGAIVTKGLQAGLACYNGQLTHNHWPEVVHNWNLVCNGGMIIGSLAVAEDEPDLATTVIIDALHSMPLAMATYAPDGGWPEGPGYWEYATKYAVMCMASMQTALGTDFGLSDLPGFSKTGFYRIYMVGPSKALFNFADSGDRSGDFPESLWLAKRFGQPIFAWSAMQGRGTHDPLALFWLGPNPPSPSEAQLPLDAVFHGVNVAVLRSSWDDQNATYVGFKGGDNGANHAHLDEGSFVLDAQHLRWVMQLGGDDYNLPGYFHVNQRFTYYRLGSAGQNELIIGDGNQQFKAKSQITNFQSSPAPSATADLTPAYSPLASHVERTVTLLQGGGVVVDDTVEAPAPTSVRWQVHTKAAITLNGPRATLSLNGKTLYVRILKPSDAVFSTQETPQAPPERPNTGVTKLVIDLGQGITSTNIAVVFSADPNETP